MRSAPKSNSRFQLRVQTLCVCYSILSATRLEWATQSSPERAPSISSEQTDNSTLACLLPSLECTHAHWMLCQVEIRCSRWRSLCCVSSCHFAAAAAAALIIRPLGRPFKFAGAQPAASLLVRLFECVRFFEKLGPYEKSAPQGCSCAVSTQ